MRAAFLIAHDFSKTLLQGVHASCFLIAHGNSDADAFLQQAVRLTLLSRPSVLWGRSERGCVSARV